MDANPFDLAAEFCKLVGAPSLLDYLGTSAQALPAEVAEKLRARRKYMQGMQANPKYKGEANFLIKNFNALAEALGDPRVYAEDVARRAEAGQLAALEAKVRGVLAAGSPTAEQETYLRKHAKELRISERSYERLLRRLAREVNAELPLPPPTPSLMPESTAPSRVKTLPTGTPSSPPDRRDTAPPVIRRSFPSSDGLPARLEVMGEPVLRARRGVVSTLHIPLRNRGGGPMPGVVRVDVPWLVPVQSVIEPEAAQQTVEVRVVPSLVRADDNAGRVEINAGSAGSASIEVELLPMPRRVWRWVAGTLGIVAALGIGVGALGIARVVPTTLAISVDPPGTVWMDGAVVGTGSTVRVGNPTSGRVAIRVEGGRNFKPWERTIEVRSNQETRVDARLELRAPLGEAAGAAGDAPGCEDAASRRAVGERLPSLKRCLGDGDGDGEPVSVLVRVGVQGAATGLDVKREIPARVRKCVERQVAALAMVPPPEAACLVAFEIPRP